MKLTQEMINRSKEMAEDPYREYQYIGVRVQDVPFELGAIDHLSHVWDDGDDTGVELPGLSVLGARFLGQESQYFGSHVAIIGSNNIQYGQDAGELVMEAPVVLEILA